MNYIVLDLEWNQSPLGKEFEIKKLPFEIIEIGAVKLDDNLKEVDRFHKIVRPDVYKDLHYKTKQIVNLTNEDLRKGEPFREAFASFRKWCGNDYIFCTWGNMDLIELQRNIKYFGIRELNDGPLKYYDIQKLFSLRYEDGKLRRTLQFAINNLNLKENLTYHSALNDAIYTAMVMKHIDFGKVRKNYSIDCFHIPKSVDDEVHAVFETYSKFISRGFTTREELLEDKEVMKLQCYVCGRNCRRKIRWFSNNNKTYYTLGICKEHGYIKSKLRLKQAENELFYAIKTTKLVDEKGAQSVRDKQNILREKRRERRKRFAMEQE